MEFVDFVYLLFIFRPISNMWWDQECDGYEIYIFKKIIGESMIRQISYSMLEGGGVRRGRREQSIFGSLCPTTHAIWTPTAWGEDSHPDILRMG